MNTKMRATAAMVSAMTLSAATSALAKGHDQGFGAQLAGLRQDQRPTGNDHDQANIPECPRPECPRQDIVGVAQNDLPLWHLCGQANILSSSQPA